MKKIYIIGIVLLIIAFVGMGIYFLQKSMKNTSQPTEEENNQNQETQKKNYSGLQIEVLKGGSGEAAKTGDKVTVDYVGTFTNGTKFDSSIDRGTPYSFTLGQGQVIQGWELGILGMQVGEKRKLTIPYNLAYGESGYRSIPAKATLIFEVELLGINQ